MGQHAGQTNEATALFPSVIAIFIHSKIDVSKGSVGVFAVGLKRRFQHGCRRASLTPHSVKCSRCTCIAHRHYAHAASRAADPGPSNPISHNWDTTRASRRARVARAQTSREPHAAHRWDIPPPASTKRPSASGASGATWEASLPYFRLKFYPCPII